MFVKVNTNGDVTANSEIPIVEYIKAADENQILEFLYELYLCGDPACDHDFDEALKYAAAGNLVEFNDGGFNEEEYARWRRE